MPRTGKPKETPDVLKPYEDHGVDVSNVGSDKNVRTDCPWCGKENKFRISVKNGLWRCFGCNEGSDDSDPEKFGGNHITFIRKMHQYSFNGTTKEEYESLRATRQFFSTDSIKAWGLAMSPAGEWVAPGYNGERNMTGMYRYSGGVWYPTSTMGTQLFLPTKLLKVPKRWFITEGVFDGIMLWETLKIAGELTGTGVCAIPGVLGWQSMWNILMKGCKEIIIVFDNDYPREVMDRVVPPAAYTGVKRTSRILHQVTDNIRYVKWGTADYHSEERAEGLDVSDVILQGL